MRPDLMSSRLRNLAGQDALQRKHLEPEPPHANRPHAFALVGKLITSKKTPRLASRPGDE